MTEWWSRQTCRKPRKLGHHGVITEVVLRQGVAGFLKLFVLHNPIPKIQGGNYLWAYVMFNFLKIYQKTRLEKVSFDKYEGSLFSCSFCYLLSLVTSEILIKKKKEGNIRIEIQRLTLLLGAEKLSQIVFPGQEDWSWNSEAWGHVSRVGGLCFQESRCTYHFQCYLHELVLCLLAQAVNKDSWGGGFTASNDSNLL